MLAKDHPALGAFLPWHRRPYVPDWAKIAEELAHCLRVRTGHMEVCSCEACLALKVYDEASYRVLQRRQVWPKRS